MKVGEFWRNKYDNHTTIKLTRFLGGDVWSCRNVDDGSDDDFFGNYIYSNFYKIEDPETEAAYEEDLNRFDKMLKKITKKVLKQIRRRNDRIQNKLER